MFFYFFTELKKNLSLILDFVSMLQFIIDEENISALYSENKVIKFVHNIVQTLRGNHPFLGQGVPHLSRVLQVTQCGVIMHIHIR